MRKVHDLDGRRVYTVTRKLEGKKARRLLVTGYKSEAQGRLSGEAAAWKAKGCTLFGTLKEGEYRVYVSGRKFATLKLQETLLADWLLLGNEPPDNIILSHDLICAV